MVRLCQNVTAAILVFLKNEMSTIFDLINMIEIPPTTIVCPNTPYSKMAASELFFCLHVY